MSKYRLLNDSGKLVATLPSVPADYGAVEVDGTLYVYRNDTPGVEGSYDLYETTVGKPPESAIVREG